MLYIFDSQWNYFSLREPSCELIEILWIYFIFSIEIYTGDGKLILENHLIRPARAHEEQSLSREVMDDLSTWPNIYVGKRIRVTCATELCRICGEVD